MMDDRIISLLDIHLARYPAMEIADVYKLLHQATFGPGHLVSNKKTARESLEHDFEVMGPPGEEALVEHVHPAGMVVRLHLRPFAAYGGEVKKLLDAMVRSAEQVTGDPAQMAAWWDVFARRCQPGAPLAGQFPLHELTLFGRVRAEEQWPAVHHSPAYNEMYRPSYRVLTEREAESLCASLRVPYEPV